MIDKVTITKSAQKLVQKGQIDKAISEWKKLLAETKDGNVYNTIGDLYLRTKAKREAVEAFSAAAGIFREEGFHLKAIALYKKILNVFPSEVSALLALAELNAEKGLISNARENFLAAADIYIREGETQRAIEIYEQLLKLTPANIDLRLKIVELYQKIGLNDEVIKVYAEIASSHLQKGELEKAREFYLKAVDTDSQNISSFIGLSRIAEKTGDIQQAYEYLNKAMSFASDDVDVLRNYSRLAIETGHMDGAEQALSELIKIEPSNNQYKKHLGTIYLKEGTVEKAWDILLPYIDESLGAERWSEALELLDNFKDHDPVEVKRRLIIIYKGKDDKDAAINELNALVGIYENKDLPQDVLKSCKEIVELNPSDEAVKGKIKELENRLGIEEKPPSVSLEEGPVEEILLEIDKYVSQGLDKEAATLLEKLRDREPDSVEIRTRLKNIYIKSEENDKAIGECLKVAELYEKKGDQGAKNTVIAEAISLNPDDPRLVRISEPSVDVERGEPVSEKEAAPSAEESRGGFQEELAEADFYAKQGLTDEAVGLYKKLLSTFPDNEEIIKRLRDLKPGEMTGEKPAEEAAAQATLESDVKGVFQEFKKGIEEELDEKDVETRYDLGIAYKEMGLLDDAIREFKIAAKDTGKVLQSSSMLAVCYMGKGLYPLAIQEFKKIVDTMSPSDEGYLGAKCDLADAYVKNKDYNKALNIYSEINAQDPNFRDVASKVKILKSMESEDKDRTKTKKDRVSYI